MLVQHLIGIGWAVKINIRSPNLQFCKTYHSNLVEMCYKTIHLWSGWMSDLSFLTHTDIHTQSSILGTAWRKAVSFRVSERHWIHTICGCQFNLPSLFIVDTEKLQFPELDMRMYFHCSYILLQLNFVSSTAYFCLELHNCIFLLDRRV